MSDVLGDVRRCDDCGNEYGSLSRTCPACGSHETEFDLE